MAPHCGRITLVQLSPALRACMSDYTFSTASAVSSQPPIEVAVVVRTQQGHGCPDGRLAAQQATLLVRFVVLLNIQPLDLFGEILFFRRPALELELEP